MPAEWEIQHWPRCDFHAFLSHCAEDRNRLIIPVHRRLEALRILPWLDQHEYPAGRDPCEILREEILRCRHVVFFVTENMLRQARGWPTLERAYSELTQRRLQHGSLELCHVELPLIFVHREHPVLNRSVWSTVLAKAAFYPGRPRSHAERIEWASSQVEEFIRREEAWGLRIGQRIQSDSALSAAFREDPNLFRRIIAASPPPITFAN